jgi:hypothetical protein
MSDPVAAVGAVNAVSASGGARPLSAAMAAPEAALPQAPSTDVANFQAMVQSPARESGMGEVGSKLVDAGVSLSQRYAERIDAAHQLASISPEEMGLDQTDYMRTLLSVQASLNEVTVELQSTAQIANSVKDSFNGLYRMQG